MILPDLSRLSARMQRVARKLLPFLAWTGRVDRTTLRADLMAGLTGAAVVPPQGVAFALIAGLPPVYGLYAAMVPPVVAGLFGSSMHLVSGPTTAISIVVFSTLSPLAAPGSAEYVQLALTLAFLAGLIQLALGLGRLGLLTNFVSHSVVVGFTAGAAILIATSQLKNFFGVEIPAGESFLHTWEDFLAQLDAINPSAVAVGGTALVTTLLVSMWRRTWPAMLIGLVAASLVAALIGPALHDVPLVGELPRELPPLSAPSLTLGTFSKLSTGALAIAMLGLVEAVSIARAVALKSGQRIDSNQEFIGQGLANTVGSFFSAYPSSGSFTRSGINHAAGARTPLSALFAALALIAVLLAIAPLAAWLPIPAMAGLLFLVAARLIDLHHVRTIARTSRREAAVLGATFLATLFVELEFAIYLGVLLSLVLYLLRTSRPNIITLVPDDEDPLRAMMPVSARPECPQLKLIRVDGSLFFGAVDHVQQTLQTIRDTVPVQRHVVIVGGGINFLDVAGAEMLVQEAEAQRHIGGGLYIAKAKGEVCRTLLRGGYIERFDDRHVFPSKAAAISTLVPRLDNGICRECTVRLFRECAQRPAPPLPEAHSADAETPETEPATGSAGTTAS
ncbi:MAG: SulP family inorganic anion transporter [Gammaproteobacteria bacterium]|nr:SulP family inorganic anion transporter [Gammaproteobacteria bacterium]